MTLNKTAKLMTTGIYIRINKYISITNNNCNYNINEMKALLSVLKESIHA